MFNTNVSVRQISSTNIQVKKEAQQQVLEIKKEHKGSFFVNCKVDDDVWKGLFYETPFLNKYVSYKANCDPFKFSGSSPKFYQEERWATKEQNQTWKDQYNARVEKIIAEQRVEVKQVKILDKTGMALIEVCWLATEGE
jgi:hypothetical protein